MKYASRSALALAIVAAVTVSTIPIEAQRRASDNAALRYWTAFALMQDGPADKPTADLLENVLAGKAPWNEAKLGPFSEVNDRALEVLKRAVTLDACDWGVEYELGAWAPIPHVAKSRALGRLNALAGIRLAARREMPAAVETWLTGIRFSLHVPQGGSLISVLTASGVFSVNADALERAASANALGPAERQKVAALLRSLPDTLFDWGAALDREAEVLGVELNQMRERGYYFMSPEARSRLPNNGRPTPIEIVMALRVMRLAVDAFRLPVDAAAARVAEAEAAHKALPAPLQQIVPNYEVVQQARVRLKNGRDRLVQAVSR